MEPSRQVKPPDFTNEQLEYVISLAQQDAEITAFIARMDRRATIGITRAAAVSGIALKAAEILQFRKQVMEAVQKRMAEQPAAPSKPSPVQDLKLEPVKPDPKPEPKLEPAGV